MPDYEPNLGEYEPSWIQDGGGISGGSERDVDLGSSTSWDLSGITIDTQGYDLWATTDHRLGGDDVGGRGQCSPTAPPGSGTYVWGSIDGACQWISTTECP